MRQFFIQSSGGRPYDGSLLNSGSLLNVKQGPLYRNPDLINTSGNLHLYGGVESSIGG